MLDVDEWGVLSNDKTDGVSKNLVLVKPWAWQFWKAWCMRVSYGQKPVIHEMLFMYISTNLMVLFCLEFGSK